MLCIVLNGKRLPHSEVLVERLQRIEGMVSVVLNVNREKNKRHLRQKNHHPLGEGYGLLIRLTASSSRFRRFRSIR